MRLLILLALVGMSLAAPEIPQDYDYAHLNRETNLAQGLSRKGDSYHGGYEFPERIHHESRDDAGQVDGFYGYVDANGVPILVKYKSNPESGFTAEIQEVQSVHDSPIASIVESALGLAAEVTEVRNVVRAGRTTRLEVLEDGSFTIKMFPEAVQEAGSVSN